MTNALPEQRPLAPFPEQPRAPEQTPPPAGEAEGVRETAPEALPTKEAAPEQKPPARLFDLLRRKRPSLPAAALPRDPVVTKIEKIMEDGVGEAYSHLSPIAKQEFKLKGEQTARQIGELLKATHVKVKKVLRLILEWLKLLPGVNRFFLEQEAKIKTDRIIALHGSERAEKIL